MRFADYPSLEDRAVLITGGAHGIGAALVAAFAGQKARVAFVDRDGEAGRRVAANVVPGHLFVECDLTNEAAIADAVRVVEQSLGPLRVLVNNAGDDTRQEVAEVTGASWDQTIASNLRHQFFASQAVAPAMARAGGGSIVNLGSIMASAPGKNLPAYAAAKAGVIGLTRSLARELGPMEIRVNAIVPGWTLTERQREHYGTPENLEAALERQCLKRHVTPEAVARMALFLAADDSDNCTGQSFTVDAGTW